jgi:hypothetical protein
MRLPFSRPPARSRLLPIHFLSAPFAPLRLGFLAPPSHLASLFIRAGIFDSFDSSLRGPSRRRKELYSAWFELRIGSLHLEWRETLLKSCAFPNHAVLEQNAFSQVIFEQYSRQVRNCGHRSAWVSYCFLVSDLLLCFWHAEMVRWEGLPLEPTRQAGRRGLLAWTTAPTRRRPSPPPAGARRWSAAPPWARSER